jgi:hypothetical protein
MAKIDGVQEDVVGGENGLGEKRVGGYKWFRGELDVELVRRVVEIENQMREEPRSTGGGARERERCGDDEE